MLNQEQKELRVAIQKLRHEMALLSYELEDLKRSCPHEIVETKYHTAECAICNKRFGWWCPESSLHYCQYTVDYDSCDFCGQPEERK